MGEREEWEGEISGSEKREERGGRGGDEEEMDKQTNRFCLI